MKSKGGNLATLAAVHSPPPWYGITDAVFGPWEGKRKKKKHSDSQTGGRTDERTLASILHISRLDICSSSSLVFSSSCSKLNSSVTREKGEKEEGEEEDPTNATPEICFLFSFSLAGLPDGIAGTVSTVFL